MSKIFKEKIRMEKISKLFGGLNMSWPRLLIFALIVGAYTGIVGIIPALEQTSFHDIYVTTEVWVIFAFIIATNCEKSWEAALKVFVFFLITQPLIFGIGVLSGTTSPDMAIFYYTTNWGPKTLFTLPGGFIAFYIKKQNWLGAIILGLGCALQVLMGCAYIGIFLQNPPFHLLTVLVCFGSAFVFTYCIQKDNKRRAVCAIIAVLATALVFAYVMSGRGFYF